jgi:small subunit ribosomal protein S20
MPNIKSAKKELRKSAKRQKINNDIKAGVRKLIKNNLKAVAAKEMKVKEEIAKTIKAIDKMAKKGIIKKNNAARQKSKLQKKVNALFKK